MARISEITNSKQEKSKLYKSVWQIASDLRDSVDGWNFKQYVLGMPFYSFISENFKNYINDIELKAHNNPKFDYINLSDDVVELGRIETIKRKSSFILHSKLFENVSKRDKEYENFNETLSNVFCNIENSAKGFPSKNNFKGLLYNIDLNSSKLVNTVEKRNEKLVEILNAIGDLKLGNSNFNENSIDAFGDAYKFLMTMYASNAGKSEINKIYDPCCSSVSLLLQFAKILGKNNVKISIIHELERL